MGYCIGFPARKYLLIENPYGVLICVMHVKIY